MNSVLGNHHRHLSPAQRDRLSRFNLAQSVDVHCHCLPGLDDGPRTMSDALALCQALVADGITTVIATPHQLGRYGEQNSASMIRQRARELREVLAEHSVPLTIEVGADVRVDERLLLLLDRDEVLTVADGETYLLVELPHDILIDLTPLVVALRSRDVTPVVTHPERHIRLVQRPELVEPWLDAGAVLQVTSGSLLGHFGPEAQQTAWDYMSAGYVSVLASDAHDVVRRVPTMSAATELVAAEMGHAIARRVCMENPFKMLQGQPMVPMFARSTHRESAS